MDIDERHQQVALFRYSLIRPLADPELSARERGALVGALVSVDHLGVDGRRVEVSAPTLRRWLRAWRLAGFAGLVPAVRAQPTRTPAAVLEQAEVLKREAPRRTAAQVARALAEAQVGVVSARTLQRHFARLGLNRSPDGSPPRAYGRFEAGDFGQLWTGDGLHGPVVAGRRAVLCAFVDDWSRAVPGWRWGHAEDTVRLEAALRRGVESRGVPDRCFVDNGSAFISAPFHRTLAVLGIAIAHSRPGQPASRGKVERFFRTVRTQFLVELDARGGVGSLAELNELFGGWLEGVYHRARHSETGETPLERVVRGRALRRPTPAELHEAFLWSAHRIADKTATVSLFGNHYELDPALAGAKVELVFDPFDLADIDVRYQGRPMGKAIVRRIRRHTHPKARPDAAPTPKASGIDYLGLVSARVAAENARRIAYAQMNPEPTSTGEDGDADDRRATGDGDGPDGEEMAP
ncbi:MAG: DDE-type integrase/transposase/recombinase [Acidimicrobiales bacterium]